MRLPNDGCREIYCIFLDTLEKWQVRKSGDENSKGALERRRGAASLIGWYPSSGGEERTRENTMVLDVFVHATSTVAAAEKRGSRLVGVVHHRVNWRCSGHSVNPGRSITAKRSRCSSSKRASLPLALLLSTSPGSLLFLRRSRGNPFRLSKKKAAHDHRAPLAYGRERTGCLMADDYSTDRMGRATTSA